MMTAQQQELYDQVLQARMNQYQTSRSVVERAVRAFWSTEPSSDFEDAYQNDCRTLEDFILYFKKESEAIVMLFKDEARAWLLSMLKPGDMLLTVLRKHTNSYKVIDVFKWDKTNAMRLSGRISTALEMKYDDKNDGIRVNGSGISADSEITQRLGVELFGDKNALNYQRL